MTNSEDAQRIAIELTIERPHDHGVLVVFFGEKQSLYGYALRPGIPLGACVKAIDEIREVFATKGKPTE